MKKTTTLLIVMCLGLLFAASTALAATITVTNTNDDGTGSLRAAIAAASPGDTIKFALTYPATITLSNTLSITQNLTIQGPGQSNLTISGNRDVGNFSVFSVSPGVIAAISGLTIGRGFNAGGTGSGLGAGIYNAGTLTLTNITVSGNLSYFGAGIYNAGTLTVTKGTFSGNYAMFSGAGIYNDGTLTVTFSTFSPNYAEASGAGIWNNGGTVTISNSTFSDNDLEDFCGGAIANEDEGTVTVTNSTFSHNGSYCGGAFSNGGTLTITNSTVWSNGYGSGLAGGVDNGGTLIVTNSTFSDNVGGIVNGGTLIVKNTILANNGGWILGNCYGAPAISAGHNLSDDDACDFAGIGDLNNTPAGLDPGGLQNNGGPTQTIALLATSPAVDAIPVSPINYCTLTDGVTPIATDQRGVIRPQLQNCDIGAYEFATAKSLLARLQSEIEKSIPDGTGAVKRKLQEASAQLSSALAEQNWTGSDGNHLHRNHALQFFLKEELAALDLTFVLGNKQSQIPPQEVQTDLDNLAFANRLLATVAIADAAGRNPNLLSWASAQLAAGDRATATGDYNAAIFAYAAAWTLAESAL